MGRKLALAFSMLVALGAATGGIALRGLGQVNAGAVNTSTVAFPRLSHVGRMRRAATEYGSVLRDYLLSTLR